jgi:hypothetical protein
MAKFSNHYEQLQQMNNLRTGSIRVFFFPQFGQVDGLRNEPNLARDQTGK